MNDEYREVLGKLVDDSLSEIVTTPKTAENRAKALAHHDIFTRYCRALDAPEITPPHFALNTQTMSLLWYHFHQTSATSLANSERTAELEARVDRLESDNRALREQMSSLRSFVISLSHMVEDSERQRIARLRDSLDDAL
jgi:hypothetical protein